MFQGVDRPSKNQGTKHEANRFEVYVMDSDGSNVRRVTNSPPGITAVNPVWKIVRAHILRVNLIVGIGLNHTA